MYYKREDDQRWKGPAKVLGQDGPVVFIRQGSRYIKAHVCCVQFADPHIQDQVKVTSTQLPCTKENVVIPVTKKTTSEEENESDDETPPPPVSMTAPETHQQAANKAAVSAPRTASTTSRIAPSDQPKIKVNQKITFQQTDGQHCEAKILSRAGKSTGQYSKWFNIQYKSPNSNAGKITSLDFSNVRNIQILENESDVENEQDVVTTDEVFELKHESFVGAKEEELNSWKEHHVYEEVPYKQQKCISVRWVCSLKPTNDGLKPKARLVARGYEETGIIEKDSPTCAKDSLRVMISVINQNRWKMKSIDIKTAFLQGEFIDRNVFLYPPPEAHCAQGYVWKLRKCVYGLLDASLKWYQRGKNTISTLGGKVSHVDPAFFTWHKEGVLIGMIAVHVDDFLWSGDSYFSNQIIPQLRSTFTVGRKEEVTFRYLGLNICQDEESIIIDQADYINRLQPTLIDRSGVEKILSSKKRDVLRSEIGQLLWVSNQTRPDISFNVSNLAVNMEKSTSKDIVALNKVIRKLKNDSHVMTFKRLQNPIKIIVYTDAAFGNLPDGGSQGAYLIFLADENNSCNIISWQSKHLKLIVRSSLAAETLAMGEGIDAALYFSAAYCEIVYGHNANRLPIETITDNKSLVEALKSSKYCSDKRLRIDIGALKQLIANKDVVKIHWVKTDEQLADTLTKNGLSSHKLVNTLKTGHLPNIV